MNKNYFRLIKTLKPYKGKLVLSLLFALLFAAANVFFMPLIKDIVTEISNKNMVNMNNHIFNALLLYFIYLATKYGQIYIMAHVSYSIVIDIRVELYEKLQTLSLDFFQEKKIGDILSRFFADVEKVREAIMVNFQQIIPQIFGFIGVTGYLFYLNWRLSFISLIGAPLFILLVSYVAKKLKRVSQQIQQKIADITHIVQEVFSNIQVVKTYQAEDFEITRFKKENKRSFTAIMRSMRITSTLESTIAYSQFLVFAIIIWYGGYEVVKGYMTGATLASFFTGILLLIDPVLSLSRVYTVTQQSMAAVDRIYNVLDLKPTIVNIANPQTIKKVKGNMAFKNVYFKYKEEQANVLKDINIEAREGEIIAFVGLSGAGKSTLVNLLPRFFDPTEGEISLDGIPLKNLDLHFLRSCIATVPQDTSLFRGTLLENIRYGKLDATEAEIEAAAKKANAWEFIEKMPNKLLTKIGDRGQTISGGQKQRISIARAILKKPKILILDEATSALDSESEKLIQEALNVLMRGRTTFVIAHRLSTIKHADKIIVLSKGKIVETGTHKKLLAQKGGYSKLYRIQFEKHSGDVA